MNDERIKTRLIAFRKYKGLSQKKLAELAEWLRSMKGYGGWLNRIVRREFRKANKVNNEKEK